MIFLTIVFGFLLWITIGAGVNIHIDKELGGRLIPHIDATVGPVIALLIWPITLYMFIKQQE